MPELEVWLCPVHLSLDESGKLEPLDNCVACLRVERDEARDQVAVVVEFVKNMCTCGGGSLTPCPYQLFRDRIANLSTAAEAHRLAIEQDAYDDALQAVRSVIFGGEFKTKAGLKFVAGVSQLATELKKRMAEEYGKQS